MLTFVIVYCYHLQSSLLSLCNKSSVSAIAAQTDILELHVGWSAIVTEFQRHPGNDTFLAAVLFTETGRNQNGPNQTSKEGGKPQPCFQRPKIAALTKQCVPAHHLGERSSPGFAIVLDVFGRLAPSDVATPPGNNAG
jgi:hypothetical protein